ncbi:hypothetical protein AB0N05_00500 [Nocardia sp. NPDC051030]|uniref:hypothetical protein n=1 Tax=Nocardia sp. NPDC051030 TaxID=3155162 RepID=UPI003430F1D5
MRLQFLGKGGSGDNDCPTLYQTDRGSFLVQGWKTDRQDTIEIPHLLPGFADPDTFMGATLTDTGRGTFTVSGQSIDDAETLSRLTMAVDEAVIEIPKLERTFYGAASPRTVR